MDEMNFGDVLRQAREQSGEDLLSVARRIRIRPDILERIEESDVDAMPPRGYSRNMINAYARYLGLNTAEIVKMYQNAQYRNQVEHARENIRSAGLEATGVRREPQTGAASSLKAPADRRRSSAASRPTPPAARGVYDNPVSSDIDAAIAPPKERFSSIGAVHVGSYNAYGQGLSQRNARKDAQPAATRRMETVDDARRRDTRSTHKARRSTMPSEHYTNLYAAPKNIGVHVPSWRDKVPFVIAGIIVILLVVVITIGINAFGRSQAEEPPAAPMNVTGLPGSQPAPAASSDKPADTGQGESQGAPQASAPAEKAPEKTVMAYDIPEGASTYFEVYVDGKYVDGGSVSGPQSGSFDVTGDFEFRVTPPEGVTLTQDGVPVALEANSAGVANVAVSFADVLAAWSEAHPDAAAAA